MTTITVSEFKGGKRFFDGNEWIQTDQVSLGNAGRSSRDDVCL